MERLFQPAIRPSAEFDMVNTESSHCRRARFRSRHEWVPRTCTNRTGTTPTKSSQGTAL